MTDGACGSQGEVERRLPGRLTQHCCTLLMGAPQNCSYTEQLQQQQQQLCSLLISFQHRIATHGFRASYHGLQLLHAGWVHALAQDG